MNKTLYRFLYRFAYVGLIGGTLLAVGMGQTWGWWVFAAGIASVAWLFVWAFTRAIQASLASRRTLVDAEAPIAEPEAPSPIEVVLAELAALGGPDVPFEVTSSPDGAETLVDVRWRTDDPRWERLFIQGDQTLAWRMEVRLDPRRATYRFVEKQSSAPLPGLRRRFAWNWSRGRAVHFQLSATVSPSGEVEIPRAPEPQTSWEHAVGIEPRDVKVPVFRALRRHGWRPPRDSWLARAFED